MKFLLIGNGFIAPRHKESIEFIKGEIVDIIDLSRGENAWQETIKNTEADCVVILTPNDLHFEMAKLAAEQGKIVLCEKPLAIKSEHLEILSTFPNVFTVLQLRFHPDIEKIRAEQLAIQKKHEIEMDISVYRDEAYYAGWKGQTARSGGVLFNLGIHYFDLLLYLFGPATEIITTSLDEKTGTGIISGENYRCTFKVSTAAKQTEQKRVFKINGTAYNFSSQDNLSFEGLHHFVYQDLLKNQGITPKEALKATLVIEKLVAQAK